MSTKAERKERIERNRARGRGRKTFWLLVLGAVVVAGVGLVRGFGHERPGWRQGGPFGAAASPDEITNRIDMLLDHLHATDAQRERISALVEALSPELIELSAQRDALRDQLFSALKAEELTASRIETVQEQVVKQGSQLTERALEIVFEIASELTPEQRAELIERWERR